MKKLVFFLGVACFSLCANTSFAQSQKYLETARIKTSVENCKICKKNIEDYFRREPGISRVDVNTYNKVVTVRYYSDRTNLSNIRTAIANVGYDADTVKANPESYARLPACCKKGGMEKLKEEQRKKH